MIILRLTKIGSKRAVVHQLDPEYDLMEVQNMLNFSIESKSPVQLSAFAKGMETTVEVTPFDSAGNPVYDHMELMEEPD